MKPYIFRISVYALLIFPSVVSAQVTGEITENKIFPDDLKTLLGEWEGTLTYLDYSSGKPFEMPANVTIEPGKNSYQLKLYNVYPNEPKANSKAKIVISKEGHLINGKPIASRKLKADEVEITVEYSGKDGNDGKMAIIKESYIIGTSQFTIRKEVKFSEETGWVKRNEFAYRKN